MEAARAAALDAILGSNATLKLIVAGPGTGKSHTFSKVLERVKGNALVLSFLGTLVADLRSSLGHLADVRTFHSYCRGRLHNMHVPGIGRNVDYFPKLGQITVEDLRLTTDPDVTQGAVEAALMLLDDTHGLVAAALHSGDYYNAVGHTDAVYRVFRAWEASPASVPTFAQVLVDEYQDFSLLEVSLLRLLAAKSPALIVGDDDQALYGFKNASADHIRRLAADQSCARFELPFCSRCPAVLVEAAHRAVAAAQAEGLLADRISKSYICFMPTKREDSKRYPRITHARCTVQRNNAPYMSRYVAESIAAISAEDIATSVKEDNPTVLIIGRGPFNRQVYDYLVDQGVPNVSIPSPASNELTPLDGYLRLAKTQDSRLGWRILLDHYRPPGWDEAVVQALRDGVDLRGLLAPAFVDMHLARARLVDALLGKTELSDEHWTELEAATGLPRRTILMALGLIEPEPQPDLVENQPSVVVTNLVTSKGLQAEHVFIVGVNEGYFPADNHKITEEEVCQLLVALTRAKKSCTLVSTNRLGHQTLGQSRFVSWLDDLVAGQSINAAYFV